MLLLIISFFAGLVTIASPCIVPVLPFVFGRPGSFRMFGGLAAGFSLVLVLAIATNEWASSLHETGRTAALIAMVVFGFAMLWPAFGERLFIPLQSVVQSIMPGTGKADGRWADWILGASTGLLWAPCAGPVLGSLLSGARATGGSSVQITFALIAFATGAASSFIIARIALGRLGQHFTVRVRSVMVWSMAVRRITGALMILGAALIATGLSNSLAVNFSTAPAEGLEKMLLNHSTSNPFIKIADSPKRLLPDLGAMPSIQGGTAWVGGKPIQDKELKGKVVLVEFWTFGCINCKRAIPYVQAWHKTYERDGLLVVGVHTPEFAYERDPGNVQKAMEDMGLNFVVTMDNKFNIWNQWGNQYWPTLYLVDHAGRIRWKHIGEGSYKKTEEVIQQLLREKNAQGV